MALIAVTTMNFSNQPRSLFLDCLGTLLFYLALQERPEAGILCERHWQRCGGRSDGLSSDDDMTVTTSDMWFPKKAKTMENPNHPVVMDEHDLVT